MNNQVINPGETKLGFVFNFIDETVLRYPAQLRLEDAPPFQLFLTIPFSIVEPFKSTPASPDPPHRWGLREPSNHPEFLLFAHTNGRIYLTDFIYASSSHGMNAEGLPWQQGFLRYQVRTAVSGDEELASNAMMTKTFMTQFAGLLHFVQPRTLDVNHKIETGEEPSTVIVRLHRGKALDWSYENFQFSLTYGASYINQEFTSVNIESANPTFSSKSETPVHLSEHFKYHQQIRSLISLNYGKIAPWISLKKTELWVRQHVKHVPIYFFGVVPSSDKSLEDNSFKFYKQLFDSSETNVEFLRGWLGLFKNPIFERAVYSIESVFQPGKFPIDVIIVKLSIAIENLIYVLDPKNNRRSYQVFALSLSKIGDTVTSIAENGLLAHLLANVYNFLKHPGRHEKHLVGDPGAVFALKLGLERIYRLLAKAVLLDLSGAPKAAKRKLISDDKVDGIVAFFAGNKLEVKSDGVYHDGERFFSYTYTKKPKG